MVWQEMTFGNDWEPGTYDFKQQIELEAEYQLRRRMKFVSMADAFQKTTH
jgi:hypothetical protein